MPSVEPQLWLCQARPDPWATGCSYSVPLLVRLFAFIFLHVQTFFSIYKNGSQEQRMGGVRNVHEMYKVSTRGSGSGAGVQQLRSAV